MGIKTNSGKPNKIDLEIGDVIKTEGTHGVEYLVVTMLEEPEYDNFSLGISNIGCVEYKKDMNITDVMDTVSRTVGQNRVLERMGHINDEDIDIN